MTRGTLLGFQSYFTFHSLRATYVTNTSKPALSGVFTFVPSLKEYKYTHVHLFNLYYNAVKEVLKLN